jgi:hypothetical protein
MEMAALFRIEGYAYGIKSVRANGFIMVVFYLSEIAIILNVELFETAS